MTTLSQLVVTEWGMLMVTCRLSRRFTQMALSLSQRPTTMAIPTIPSVNYQEWIARLALPIRQNRKNKLTSIFLLAYSVL